jgi:hypothetical protein
MYPMGEMNILYDSDAYCVAEFSGERGVELMDKQARRSVYLGGALAAGFRRSLRSLALADPEEADVDALIERYAELPAQPIVLH